MKKKLPNDGWLRKNGYKALAEKIRLCPEMFSDFELKKFFDKEKEHLVTAEKLAAENDGKLPNSKWLQKNGYKGFDTFRRKHKEIFKNFEIEIKRINYKSIQDHISDLLLLVEGNDNKIPSSSWLNQNGYKGLYAVMQRCPKEFVSIKEKYFVMPERKTLYDYKSELYSIIVKNNGKVPELKWLKSNGYCKLAKIISGNRSFFMEYGEEKKEDIDLNEHLNLAIEISKGNNGILRGFNWLFENGYKDLVRVIKKNPEKFEFLRQEKKEIVRKKDHVKIAEKLAKENNGKLPRLSWMKENGYGNTLEMMKKHPDSFRHIEREYQILNRKSIEDHVLDAEKLCEINRGKIPRKKWLFENGYNKLYDIMNNRPDFFDHLERE